MLPEGVKLPQEAREVPGGHLVSAKSLRLSHPFGPTRFYRHGWQSWSLAAWVSLEHPPVPIQPPERRPQCDDPPYMLSERHGGSGVGALESADGKILLLGALGLGARVEADAHELHGFYETTTGDWFVAYGDESEVFGRYAELLGERFGKRGEKPAPRVWCSWYGFYNQIYEQGMLEVLGGLEGLPFDVFQLDDGWQTDMGDWEPNAKFPSGMTEIARKAERRGLVPGIWLAPFIARPQSKLFQTHPEWFLRDERGNLVSAGVNWGGYHGLDVTRPDVRDWLVETLRTVLGWGYRYLKLDFLYAAALPGARQRDVPREQAYREAMELVREVVGEETYLLLCGAPILPSLGIADGLRIGPDVAPFWSNEDRELHLHDLTGPGGLNALHTSLHRLWLKPLVHTDPDVAYFRTRYNLLTDPERHLLQDLALASSFKATSDPPFWLSPQEQADLAAWLEHDPPVQRLGRYRYQIGSREVDFSASLRKI